MVAFPSIALLVWLRCQAQRAIQDFHANGQGSDAHQHTGQTWSWTGPEAYHDVWQNVMLYALLNSISNDTAGACRPAGSAGVSKNFSGTDVTGQHISAAQAGFVFKL